MAKIEMDLSEYEIMQENKKLLQKSLETEKTLREQIEKLNAEKIKALEDAKMKVIKITRQEVTHHALVKSPISSANSMGFWREVVNALGIRLRETDWDRFYTSRYIDADFERLRDLLFQVNEFTTFPVDEVITEGLDEIKKEIREDLKQNLDKEIQLKLGNAEEVLAKKDLWLEENESLKKENVKLNKKIQCYLEEIDELDSENEEIAKERLELRKTLETIQQELKADLRSINLLNYNQKKALILSKIDNLINKSVS